MICQCFGITERQVRQLVRAGARSPRQVARACGAGTGCGGCRQRLTQVVQSERAAAAARREPLEDLELSPAR